MRPWDNESTAGADASEAIDIKLPTSTCSYKIYIGAKSGK